MLRSILLGLCVSATLITTHADAVSDTISKYSQQLHKLDRDFVSETTINESNNSNKLFEHVQADLPDSYGITQTFMNKFNPSHNTNDHKRLANEIDAYCKYLEKQPVIQFALSKTNTTIQDLKKNWFGSGRGFEHVFPGELKGSKVSGYHFWYKYYQDQQQGKVQYGRSMEGLNDSNIFTGSFSWDPDGKGGKKAARKKKGGFTIGSSAPAIIALGHVALETKRQSGHNGSAMKFKASLNGHEYLWQMYIMGGGVRSLFPMVMRTREDEASINRFKNLYSVEN
ncbi:MAG: EndoU domain-containing protein [Candidatus Cloacimonetes bacterium]|nr:EndoU domain-containing protein [Candidatus Cloacimonadota bacterium]